MTSSVSTATPKSSSFPERSASVKTPKSDINWILLDYLVTKGYPETAARFSKEANLPYHDEGTIATRRQISAFIHMGEIEKAISELNDLDPEILDKDAPLHFALLRLQLIELIRAGNGTDHGPALTFASQQLGPRAPTNPGFLKDLEATMALLFFAPDNRPPAQQALMDPNLRREVADQVNNAIMQSSHSRTKDAAIRELVKMRAWAESEARKQKNSLPDELFLGLNEYEGDGMDDSSHENGHDAMITT